MNNIAFLTEIPFEGKWPLDFPNSRTEICWMIVLDAYHYNISSYEKVKGYDHVFCIIPKGKVYLSADGSKIINGVNPFSSILSSNFTEVLKNNNKKVHFIQEGSVDRHINDYSIEDQFNYYNHLQNFDILFAHNNYDELYYKGLFPGKTVKTIRSLMLEHLVQDIKWVPTNKVLIGGNFSHFYRGFQSFIVSDGIENHEKWVMTSHSTREGEQQIPGLNHIPRINWIDWIKLLSTFKFAIHLMNLRAAGTTGLNCGYFGIICIGSELMDTYKLIYPDWCVDVYNMIDIRNKIEIINENKYNTSWLIQEAEKAKENYKKYFHKDVFLENMNKTLNEQV